MTSTLSGVYTAEQATTGRDLFNAACAGCHTAASIVVPEFRRTWQGKNLWTFFDMVKQTMPQDNPKSLPDADYARTVAYLLEVMRLPAGSNPLVPDSVQLRRIRIDTVGTARLNQAR